MIQTVFWGVKLANSTSGIRRAEKALGEGIQKNAPTMYKIKKILFGNTVSESNQPTIHGLIN